MMNKIFEHWRGLDVGYGYNFRVLAFRSNLERAVFIHHVRELAKQGFLEYQRGLVNDEGEFYGSGYVLTAKGKAYFDGLD